MIIRTPRGRAAGDNDGKDIKQESAIPVIMRGDGTGRADPPLLLENFTSITLAVLVDARER